MDKAPSLDEPFEPTEEWGEIPATIPGLIKLIQQATKVFRLYPPKELSEIEWIKQSTGKLVRKITGGSMHREDDSWQSKKTLPYAMRILYSARLLKPKIDRRLYHEILNCLRYVWEPKKSDEGGKLTDLSGQQTLPSSIISYPARTKKPYLVEGYIFVGDEPGELHDSYVDEIICKLREVETIVATEVENVIWSKAMSKKRMMDALSLDSRDAFNSWAESIGLNEINRKLWEIRLDKLDKIAREKLEKA